MSPARRNRARHSLNSKMDGSLDAYSNVANAANVSSMATSVTDLFKEKPEGTRGRFITPISLTALATGLGTMVLAVPMEGKVVVTKANIPVNSTASLLPPTFLDLDHDGVADMELGRNGFASGGTFQVGIVGSVFNGGAIVTPHGYAAALRHGAGIGPSGKFGRSFTVELSGGTIGGQSLHFFGDWGGNPTNRFMGVKFLINGQTHYGWVRLQINTGKGDLEGTITGYAYETIPNKKLEAGVQSDDLAESAPAERGFRTSQGSLGALALGFDGLAIWRRDL
jgi:hypothetical protein